MCLPDRNRQSLHHDYDAVYDSDPADSGSCTYAGQKNKLVMSYMGGANAGDDRNFTDSFGEEKHMSLANWYMPDYFGENKLLLPSMVLAAGALIILMIMTIGGAL